MEEKTAIIALLAAVLLGSQGHERLFLYRNDGLTPLGGFSQKKD